VMSLVMLCPAEALALGPPRQAFVTLEMPAADGEMRQQTATLDGGTAEVRITSKNANDGRTVDVRLDFSYTIPPDMIAFDEIIDRITIRTSHPDGARIGATRIVPGEINLNPNGPELHYRVTMYRGDGQFRLRVRVFGNYE
jgi:hypothetical protein